MSISDQLNDLVRLGMVISDREEAAHTLRHIGYHRLSGYWQPFLIQTAAGGEHNFRGGADFRDVIEHYNFDGYLRSSLAEALGHIEVSARALWSSHLADFGGDKAHLMQGLFHGPQYRKNLPALEQSYQRTVERGSPIWRDASVWQVTEAMSFGDLSKWYKTISARHIRTAIAAHYGLNQRIFSSALYNLTHLRNICAHHGRLWNRNLSAGLRLPQTLMAYCNREASEGLYNRLVIVAYLMRIIDPRDYWKSELVDLMVAYPGISKDRMGFPENWEDMEFWQ